MALTIGELVGYIRADGSDFERNLARSQLRMEGFRLDVNGRLRDIRGRFVNESQIMGQALAEGFSEAERAGTRIVTVFNSVADAQSRTLRGRLQRMVGDARRSGEETGRSTARSFLSLFGSTIRSGIATAWSAGVSGLQGISESLQANPYIRAAGTAAAVGFVATMLPMIASLLSGAVIVLGGLSIIGIGAALLKDEPEVKKAAEKLKDTVKGVFERAAQPLKGPFVEALKSLERTAKDVAPQIEQAFRTVAESGAIKSLTDGIDKLVKNALPGFNRMLRESGPVFEGLEGLLSRVGSGLGKFFDGVSKGGPGAKTALEDLGRAIEFTLLAVGTAFGYLSASYGQIRGFIDDVVGAFQWLYNVLVGNSIVPDLIDAIVGLFTRLPGRAAAALAAFGPRIVSVVGGAMRSMVSRIGEGLSTTVSWLRGLPGRASSALGSLAGTLRSRAADAGRQLVSATREKLSDAVSAVRGLPGRARSALGSLGGVLAAAGRSLISGFISGIASKFGDVRSTLGSLTSSLTSWKGPEDVDKRILTPAGRMVIAGFQRGIAEQTPALRAQLQGLTGQVPGMALGGLGGASSAPAGGGTATVRVVVEGPEALARVIRAIVIDKGGGNVQRALGRG